MTKVYLSLGSNIGDRRYYLTSALSELDSLPETKVKTVSSFYKTKAWGNINQDDFQNLAVLIITELKPEVLLEKCQAIEKKLGRVRHEHWGPRTIDIDILLFGEERIDLPNLKIPHPYLLERAFVLIPLLEISPDLVFLNGEHLETYCQQLDTSDIIKLK